MERRKEGLDNSDGWVEDALQIDFMAANMLMRLSGQGWPPKRWLRRLPRSTQQQPSHAFFTRAKELHDESSARASPVTPLSFSCSSSPSACCDDEPATRPVKRSLDDSSQSDNYLARAEPTRSKIVGCKTAIGLKISSRKKKTILELKEEESSLLIDRTQLIKEIEALEATWRVLKPKNKKLKKLKLDLESQSSTYKASYAPLEATATIEAASNPLLLTATVQTLSIASVPFELPDLNSLPPEEESASPCLMEF